MIDEVKAVLPAEKVLGSGLIAIAPAMIDVRAIDSLDDLSRPQVSTFFEVTLQHGR